MKAYDELYPQADERSVRVMTKTLIYEPARAVVRSFAKKGQPAYLFRFPYRAHALRAKIPGALHASKLPFVFNILVQTSATSMGPNWTDQLFSEPLTFTEVDRAMAKIVNSYWINFAKKGDLNGPGLPAWKAASTKPDAIMNFGECRAGTESDPATESLDMIESANIVLRQ